MSKLLYIQSSPRENRSYSTKVANAFIEKYQQNNSNDKIVTLNIFEESLPEFSGFTIDAKYAIMHGQEHTQEQKQAWQKVEIIIEQFKSSDKYLFSIPMWNFSIPYKLKQYFDILVQPGYTFKYTQEKGYEGLVLNKPVTVIYSRGGKYEPGSGAEAFDLQKKYTELILAFMGFTNINSILVEPTLQGGPDTSKEILEQAIENARKLADSF